LLTPLTAAGMVVWSSIERITDRVGHSGKDQAYCAGGAEVTLPIAGSLERVTICGDARGIAIHLAPATADRTGADLCRSAPAIWLRRGLRATSRTQQRAARTWTDTGTQDPGAGNAGRRVRRCQENAALGLSFQASLSRLWITRAEVQARPVGGAVGWGFCDALRRKDGQAQGLNMTYSRLWKFSKNRLY
jgi:hypothetical protein